MPWTRAFFRIPTTIKDFHHTVAFLFFLFILNSAITGILFKILTIIFSIFNCNI
jgi:hypothetical protein